MRRSLRYACFALSLCAGAVISCAPASTTARPESERNVVTAADIEQFPEMPIEMIIQRKVSGVTVHNVSGALVMQIRGQSSVNTQDIKPPLFVLNGMRLPATTNGEMPNIPIKEIQLIKVLKGADAGLYGLDGANGVIEITTKH